jgi:hypothetical protein
MKTILILIAIAASSYFYYSSLNAGDSYVDVKNLYTYEEIPTQNVNTSNIYLLTDNEYYVLESLKRTNYSFYVIGGWVRDRVYYFLHSY